MRIVNERQYCPVVLFDETSFLVVSAEQTYGVIKVYSITADVHDGLRRIAHVASFQLPPINPGYTLVPSTACYSTSYNRSYVPSEPGSAATATTLFEVSPRNCILHLRFRYGPASTLCDTAVREKNPWRMLAVSHLLRMEPFFAAIDKFRSRALDGSAVTDETHALVPWTHWGPKNSRSIRVGEANYFASHGTRALLTNRWAGAWQAETMMEFNVMPERCPHGICGPLPELADNQRYVDEKEVSSVAREDVFVEDVVGTLPYVETTFPRLNVQMSRRMVVAGDVWVCCSSIWQVRFFPECSAITDLGLTILF